MDQIEKREWVSALADGQLRGDAFARAATLAAGDAEASEAWRTYHLIGDVMRSSELARGTPSGAFVDRLRVRLEAEVPVTPAALASPVPVQAAAPVRAEAANDGTFRWKLVAGVASMAAVGALGWGLLGSAAAPRGEIAATVPAGSVLVGSDRGVVIRDARLDEMLAAHRQLGGATALQAPQGFLRNATFDATAR